MNCGNSTWTLSLTKGNCLIWRKALWSWVRRMFWTPPWFYSERINFENSMVMRSLISKVLKTWQTVTPSSKIYSKHRSNDKNSHGSRLAPRFQRLESHQQRLLDTPQNHAQVKLPRFTDQISPTNQRCPRGSCRTWVESAPKWFKKQSPWKLNRSKDVWYILML